MPDPGSRAHKDPDLFRIGLPGGCLRNLEQRLLALPSHGTDGRVCWVGPWHAIFDGGRREHAFRRSLARQRCFVDLNRVDLRFHCRNRKNGIRYERRVISPWSRTAHRIRMDCAFTSRLDGRQCACKPNAHERATRGRRSLHPAGGLLDTVLMKNQAFGGAGFGEFELKGGFDAAVGPPRW